MNHADTLYRRNRLLVYIIWGMLALGIAVSLLTGAETDSIIVLAGVGLICCAGATFMTFRRWMESYVMYYIPVVIAVLTLLMIMTAPIITTYFLVYVNLAIMTLYNQFRAQLFATLVGAALTVYLFVSPYHEAVFGDNSPLTIGLYLAMIAAPLLASSSFSQRLQTEAAQEREKAINENNRTRDLMGRIAASLRTLNDFSGKLKSNVTTTSAISREVTDAFAEVTSSIETQTGSITDIGDSIRVVEETVSSLAKQSNEMRALSENSVRLTQNGDREAQTLADKMNMARDMIERSVALMNDLNEQNRHIRDIVAAIRDISAQTHLLALNAAIEAARAGEHGRGFVVVSNEIRKLAESSQQSTEQIERILESIRTKTDMAAEQVMQGRETIQESRESAERVVAAIRALSDDAWKVDQQSARVEAAAVDMQRQYERIAGEMETISRLTEQNMAAFEQMAASMTTQNERINEIKESFLELDKLASDLNRMSE